MVGNTIVILVQWAAVFSNGFAARCTWAFVVIVVNAVAIGVECTSQRVYSETAWGVGANVIIISNAVTILIQRAAGFFV